MVTPFGVVSEDVLSAICIMVFCCPLLGLVALIAEYQVRTTIVIALCVCMWVACNVVCGYVHMLFKAVTVTVVPSLCYSCCKMLPDCYKWDVYVSSM